MLQELHSLHDDIQGLVATGDTQSSCACSLMEWGRLQGAVAVMCDKAMQCLVIGALQLCCKGMHRICIETFLFFCEAVFMQEGHK